MSMKIKCGVILQALKNQTNTFDNLTTWLGEATPEQAGRFISAKQIGRLSLARLPRKI